MNAVVVGGGIIGLACAYSLAGRGARVTVCEQSSPGGGSTGRAVGGIRAQFSRAVNVELSKASIAVWETFEEEFGVDIAYRRTGYLFLAREEATAERFRENVRLQHELGVDSEFLTPEEIHEHGSGVRSEAFVGATYHAGDGFADPHLALQGFIAGARERGVEIRPNTPVTGVLTANDETGRFRESDNPDDRVVAVETPDGRIDTEVVVNAAGPWASRIAAMAGVELPVAPRRRQVAVVGPAAPVPESAPLTIDLDSGAYFRPERGGQALVGGHFADADPDQNPDNYSTDFDLDWAAEAVEKAGDCARYFGPDSQIRRGWAGLYAVTPDHNPIVEETVSGLINAVGFSGHGFQHAPAIGRVVAEIALDGEASLVDVDSLSSDRFETGELLDERNVA